MALSWKARRRLALVILVVGLPLYVVAAVNILDRLGRLPFAGELAVYAVLGILWALPFRLVFRGVGRPDPGAGAKGDGPGPGG